MEEHVKVSVILPFHNGEAYMDETMSGLQNQTLKEIEIICVDDDSTDHTFRRLEQYAKEDNRVKVLHQKKANAGVARNLGKANAHGEYLLFLDSDDLFEPDMLQKMYDACKKDDADIAVCNADQYDTVQKTYIDKPQYLRRNMLPESIPFSKETIGKYILYFTTSVPWNKMVRKGFLDENHIEFQDIARANDQFFSICSLLLADRITVVDEKLVHYRVNQKENLTTNFSETPLCAYESMLAVKTRLDTINLLEDADVRCAFDNKIINLMIYSLNIQNTTEGYRALYETLAKEGFSKLGVFLQEEDYYFNEMEYKNFNYMLHYSYDEYLLSKNIEYRDTIERKNIRYQEAVKQKKEAEKQLKAAEQKLFDIENRKSYKLMKKFLRMYYKITGK